MMICSMHNDLGKFPKIFIKNLFAMRILPPSAATSSYSTLAAVFAEAAIIIPLESWITSIYFSNTDPFSPGEDKSIIVYLIIFCLAHLFQIILCWDALYHQNTIQILGFLFFTTAATAYAVFQGASITSNIAEGDARHDLFMDNPLLALNATKAGNLLYIPDSAQKAQMKAMLLAVPAIMAVFAVGYFAIFYNLYQEFGWKIYKKIGADPHMRYMYRLYQMFIMMIKLDVFFMFGFGIQFLVLIIQLHDPEFAITIAAIPVLMGILAMAIHGIRTENKVITISFMCGLMLANSYFAFKIFRIFTQPEKYQYTKKYLTFFALLSIIVVSVSLGITGLCYSNFGKGLKEHIARDLPSSQISSAQSNAEEGKK
ncbi:hypothetical protein HDU78_005300 [Chytriomyces hyalinus]|nr:hypothetical protein HDU78_005300 [Chytriomyces hyalinus]